jgi:hypothetical protein
MIFEWDTIKSLKNREKHGVSFEEAMEIWRDVRIDAENIARKGNESRSATLGMIKGRIYVAIWTKRKGKIRLISVRRARNNEEKIYKKNI